MTLSPAMVAMLAFAVRQGGWLVAGDTCESGRKITVSASTVRALASRGMVTLSLSPDGNMMGTLTSAGRAAVSS